MISAAKRCEGLRPGIASTAVAIAWLLCLAACDSGSREEPLSSGGTIRQTDAKACLENIDPKASKELQTALLSAAENALAEGAGRVQIVRTVKLANATEDQDFVDTYYLVVDVLRDGEQPTSEGTVCDARALKEELDPIVSRDD